MILVCANLNFKISKKAVFIRADKADINKNGLKQGS